MSQTTLDLHFADSLGRQRVVHANTIDGRGWDVRSLLNDGLFTKHCSDWQSVERTVTWLRVHVHEQSIEPKPQRPGSPALAALVAFFLAMGAAAGQAQTADPPAQALRAFETATRDYAMMHRRLEQQIGPIEINTPVESINRLIQELATSIRVERRDAKQGDLFTPALARELKASIDEALRANDFTAADVINAGRVDAIDYGRIALRVNGTFPWVLGVAMFPCVIEALPPLPPELQYRIVGNDLVLIDVHASLIVDILPNVLADLTVRTARPQGVSQ